MSISSTSRKTALFTGNGSTTSFAFTFKVQDSDDVVVYRKANGAQEVVASGYTVTLNANQNTNPGGTVDFTTAPTSAHQIRITTGADATQDVSLQNQGSFNPAVVNEALDKLTILVQQIEGEVSRALRTPIVDAAQADLAPSAGSAKYIIRGADGQFTEADAPTGTSALAAGWAAIVGASPTPVRWVATIAALKALTKSSLTAGEQRLVRSYGPREGYGGGRFRWDASSAATADNVVTFATDEGGTGRWIRMLDTPLCPTMAGVAFDSDGTAGNGTDDTDAWEVFGTYLETAKSAVIRHQVPNGISRIYPTAADTRQFAVITNAAGIDWDFNGTTLYADRDVLAEGAVIYPFQFSGTTSRDINIRNGKLRTRARTIVQTGTVVGMRWFVFDGKGSNLKFDMDVSDSVDCFYVNRQPGTDAASTRWTNLVLRVKATRSTYGVGLADSGDNALVDITTDGVTRSLIAYGVNGLRGVVRSKNHAAGDVKIIGWKNGAGVTEDRPLKNVDLVYICDPADHSETFLPGVNIDVEARGTGGATIDNVHIKAFILSNSAKPERISAKYYKSTDDGGAIDTTGSRGHVVRNCSLSLTALNIDASSIADCAQLFHSTDCGNWTGETIDNFRLYDTRTTGSKSDILFGFAGHVNGPKIENVTTDEDFTVSGSAPATMRVAGLVSDNINIGFSIGDISDRGGGVYFPVLAVATQTPASAAATGKAGTIAWDASYIYICTAANTWKRAAIATW